MTRRGTSVRDVEAPIEARDDISVDHEQLDHKVEAVEACFGVVPSRIVPRARGCEVNREAEASADREEERGEQKQGKLDADTTLTEFLGASGAGPRDDCEERDREREKGNEGTGVYG